MFLKFHFHRLHSELQLCCFFCLLFTCLEIGRTPKNFRSCIQFQLLFCKILEFISSLTISKQTVYCLHYLQTLIFNLICPSYLMSVLRMFSLPFSSLKDFSSISFISHICVGFKFWYRHTAIHNAIYAQETNDLCVLDCLLLVGFSLLFFITVFYWHVLYHVICKSREICALLSS